MRDMPEGLMDLIRVWLIMSEIERLRFVKDRLTWQELLLLVTLQLSTGSVISGSAALNKV